MKKYLLIVVAIMAVSAVFAFQPSSMLVGGTFEYKSEKADADADAVKTIAFHPQLAGLVLENLSADLILSYGARVGAPAGITGATTKDTSQFGIGVGARYFPILTLYGGADFTYAINSTKTNYPKPIKPDKGKYNAMYLTPKIGYMVPVLPSTYLDLQAYYKLGLGEYTGDKKDTKNEESGLGFRMGVQFNINM
ncbi:MAG TPA: outer membrane beta-barrel protein [Candidatus Cloacimonadota bacterium]|nr:outer membrane beta-barrel protein [Candidatus Cloacimonadota bacterium]